MAEGFADLSQVKARPDFIDEDVPQWGGKVRIRRMLPEDYLDFLDFVQGFESDKTGKFVRKSDAMAVGVRLAALSISDADDPSVRPFKGEREIELRSYPQVIDQLTDSCAFVNGLEFQAKKKPDDGSDSNLNTGE